MWHMKIRNPLSGIAIALELMQDETENEEHRQTISEILNEIVRLERIVKGLFQLRSSQEPAAH